MVIVRSIHTYLDGGEQNHDHSHHFIAVCFTVFSGSETALTASNKMRLRTQYNQGNAKAGKLLDLVSKPSEFITTILIGNNIANILLPTLVTTFAIQQGVNVGIASAILTITVIVFAEVFPKSVAATFPDRISMLVYPIIRFFTFIFKPFTIVLNWLTGMLTKALSKGQKNVIPIQKKSFGQWWRWPIQRERFREKNQAVSSGFWILTD